MRIKIDPEFSGLLGPLTDEEREQLRQNLLADGKRIVLTLWKEKGFLLDGHHRLEICKAEKLKYKTAAVSLPSREAAMLWIINQQGGRRNLSDQKRSLLRGMRHELEKLSPHRPEEKGDIVSPLPDEKTAERIAADEGVSERQVYRDAALARAVETAPRPIREAVQADKLKVTTKDLEKVGEMEAQDRRKVVSAVQRGEVETLKAAITEALGSKISGGTSFDPEEIEEASKPDIDTMAKPYRDAKRAFREGQRFVESIFEDQAQAGYAAPMRDRILGHLDGVKGIVAWLGQLTPEALCKDCKGKGCKTCHKTGWVPKGVLTNLGKK